MAWPKGKPRSAATRKLIGAAAKARHVEAQRRWSEAHPGQAAIWKLRGQQRVRIRLIEALGGKCVTCGFSDWRALQVDHVNGGGRADRVRMNNRYRWFKYVLAHPGRYQLLCSNCNWIKRYERAEHGPSYLNRLTAGSAIETNQPRLF